MQLNKIFTSHMVFPRRKPIRIYGEGNGRATITFAGQKRIVETDSEKWQIEFPPMEYGGPYELQIEYEDRTEFMNDICIGEVFLFAGQSNMQFKMEESNTDLKLYTSNNKLRMFVADRIEKTDYYTPENGWVVCEKDKVKYWSAIAYLAGNKITKDNDIAVGVIGCYQGASVIESWVPEGTFRKLGINIPISEKNPTHTQPEYSIWNGDGKLYSYAFSQVVPYSLSAVIWYQGESDSSDSEGKVYFDELKELIRIWRKDLKNKELPFIIIQLANRTDGNKGWKFVQEAQRKIQDQIPSVTTVISGDVCEVDEIHPPTKHKLAWRVADALKCRMV